MLFVTCLRPEYVWFYKNEAEILTLAQKEWLEEFKQKKKAAAAEAEDGEGE